jgi:hypothetical protein
VRLLYLPPYSPDLNLIEQLFAKLKMLLHKPAARTNEELWSTVGHLLTPHPLALSAGFGQEKCGLATAPARGPLREQRGPPSEPKISQGILSLGGNLKWRRDRVRSI